MISNEGSPPRCLRGCLFDLKICIWAAASLRLFALICLRTVLINDFETDGWNGVVRVPKSKKENSTKAKTLTSVQMIN